MSTTLVIKDKYIPPVKCAQKSHSESSNGFPFNSIIASGLEINDKYFFKTCRYSKASLVRFYK